ncbi:MAG: DinB family protein [Anaerolineae bacterium]|nr:DinB family protein [Anaerolineae bacterium]
METTEDILIAMRSAPEIFVGLLHGITQQEAAAADMGGQEWSVIEILCHLRDVEEIALQRNQSMLENDNPVIQGYDHLALVEERNYAEGKLGEALARFLDFRTKHIALLEALKPEEWLRRGQHTVIGEVTVFEHQVHNVGHDFNHAAQIARHLGKV